MLIRFSGLFLGQVGGEAGKDSGAVSGEFHGAMHLLIPQSLRDSPQGQGERIPPRRYRGSPFCRPPASGISHVPTLCLHWGYFFHYRLVFHAQRPTLPRIHTERTECRFPGLAAGETAHLHKSVAANTRRVLSIVLFVDWRPTPHPTSHPLDR